MDENKKETTEEIVEGTIEETTKVDKEIDDSEKKVDEVLEANEDSEVVKIAESEEKAEIEETPKTEEQVNSVQESQTDENTDSIEESQIDEKANPAEESQADEKANPAEESQADEKAVSDNQDESKKDVNADSQSYALSDIGTGEVYVDKTLTEQAALKVQKNKKIKKACKITAICLASTVVVAYFIVAIWFMFHYNKNTYINNIDMSFQTTTEMRNRINEFIDNYSLTIYLRGNDSHKIKPSDIDMQIIPIYDEMDAKHEQNGLLWPLYMSDEKRYTITYQVTYDEELLDQYLSGLDCMQRKNMVPAKDAYVTIKNGKSVVVEETLGTVIDYTALKDEICKSLDIYISEIDLNDNPCYYEADITSDSEEIAAIKAELDHYLDMVITYHIDEVTWDLDASTFSNWLYFENGEWLFSTEKVEVYVEGLAGRYNSVGTVRKFKTYHGNTVEEYGPRYGWTIDQEAEVEGLFADLTAGNSIERTPEFSQRGAAYNNYNDIGDTYIEVDLTNQHVYVTIDGAMVFDTACVTGCVANGHGTPSGLYSITYMESPSILRGEDYESYVSYWMPFNRGIGLHDATWRGSFGGNIYYSDGSHGCVNLPFSAAQTIYRNYAYSGMPVICYY